MKKKVHAIIQARMNSTRLPGKVLMEFSGDTVLGHIIRRVKKSNGIDKIIVATTTNYSDDKIVEFCNKYNIDVFRGDENDVLDRYYRCAIQYHSDIIVRITADDPLKDPEIISFAIDLFKSNNYDYVSNTINPTFPEGLDIEVFSFNALELAHKSAYQNSDKEHVTPYIYHNPQIFNLFNFTNDYDYSHMRWTLDNENDLIFIKTIYMNLYLNPDDVFTSKSIYKLLDSNPDISKINQGHSRNEGYQKSIAEENKK